jgi:hypothetical protein
MPTKNLPSNSNVADLEAQVEDLRRAHAKRDPQAAHRIREFHPDSHDSSDTQIQQTQLRLRDAQLTIAREYGFLSWETLNNHIEKPSRAGDLNLLHHERIEDPVFRRAVDLLDAGDADGLRSHLRDYPDLVHQHVTFEGGNYFQKPSLLEFTAENPVRHDRLPPNIVDVARVILDAGAKEDSSTVDGTLALICSGRVARECGLQLPLIDLLCDYGAGADSGMLPALGHGEFEAVEALIRRGAKIDLPVAAATDRIEAARELLPMATAAQRHLALALAVQHGHIEICRMLLDAGEDLNRYNPPGSHAHSTPLHQAALAGHEQLVRLLLKSGADPHIRDILWQGTCLDWAIYGNRAHIATYLRAQGAKTAAEL